MQDCNLQEITKDDAIDQWEGRWVNYDYYELTKTYPGCQDCELFFELLLITILPPTQRFYIFRNTFPVYTFDNLHETNGT